MRRAWLPFALLSSIPVVARAEVETATIDGHELRLTTAPRVPGPGRDAVLEERIGANFIPRWRGQIGATDVDDERRIVFELATLTRYEERTDVLRCDGRPARLRSARLDLATGDFRATTPQPPSATMALSPERMPSGLQEQSRPGGFRFEAATATPDEGAPRELDDGRTETRWTVDIHRAIGSSFIGRGEADAHITALRITPSAHPPRLRRVLLTAGDQTYALDLPKSATARSHWFVLPEPIPAQCAEVTVESVYDAAGRLEIAELDVFTDVDASGPEALDAWVQQIQRGGADIARLERRLARAGRAGVEAILRALAVKPSTEDTARLRLTLARLGDALGAEEVARGLAATTSSETAAPLAAGLVAMGPQAVVPVEALLRNADAETSARIHAAGVLAALQPELLRAAVGIGPTALRTAIVVALASQITDPARIIEPGEDRRAADLWRIATLAAARATSAARMNLAQVAVARLSAGPRGELRYRAFQALAAVADEAPRASDRLIADEPEPTLREVAVWALPANAATQPLLVARVEDTDPGVRAAALARLTAVPSPSVDGAALLRLGRDSWPMVRLAAAALLAERCAVPSVAEGLYAAARTDESDAVRRATLAGLVRCREPRVAAELFALAKTARAGTSLRAYALSLIGALGERRHAPALAELFSSLRADALASPDAALGDGEVRLAAAAAQALGALGDTGVATELVAAASDPGLPLIQASALGALAQLCPPGAHAAIEEALHAEDSLVVRAARTAKRRCLAAKPAP